MPEHILKEIQNIDSVELVAVSSFKGEIGFQFGRLIPESNLREIAVYLIRSYAAQKTMGKKLLNMEFYWQKYFLNARFADGFLIMTICSSMDVLSLLRITMNVAVANLLENKHFLKWLKKQSADPAKHLRHGSLDDLEIGLISRFS